MRNRGNTGADVGVRNKNDYYATDPIAISYLLEGLKRLNMSLSSSIIEPCVGGGHLANALLNKGYTVLGYDIVDRGWQGTKICSLFDMPQFEYDIVTNPPYKDINAYIEYMLNHALDGNLVCCFLRILFLEGTERKTFLINFPFKYMFVMSRRVSCARNGDFNKCGSSFMGYAWFIWEKGYKGDSKILWV